MEVWIIEDGEKTGPFHDYDIRSRIESGKLPGDTMVWHEGIDQWKPLSEIEIFKSEFEKPFQTPPADTPTPVESEPEPAEAPKPSPPPLDAKSPIRRFWARWMDLYLYSGIWWLAMWAAGRDIEATLQNAWIMLLLYAPWFLFETFLIHRFGATPGKWLLGLRVTNDDGSLLELGEATRRSLRILFIGIGFGWSVLSLICQAMSFVTMRRIGRPIWDHAGGHRVSASRLHPLKIMVFVFVFFGALQLQGIVLAPYTLKQLEKTFPALKEHFEKHPPPLLPQRH